MDAVVMSSLPSSSSSSWCDDSEWHNYIRFFLHFSVRLSSFFVCNFFDGFFSSTKEHNNRTKNDLKEKNTIHFNSPLCYFLFEPHSSACERLRMKSYIYNSNCLFHIFVLFLFLLFWCLHHILNLKESRSHFAWGEKSRFFPFFFPSSVAIYTLQCYCHYFYSHKAQTQSNKHKIPYTISVLSQNFCGLFFNDYFFVRLFIFLSFSLAFVFFITAFDDDIDFVCTG